MANAPRTPTMARALTASDRRSFVLCIEDLLGVGVGWRAGCDLRVAPNPNLCIVTLRTARGRGKLARTRAFVAPPKGSVTIRAFADSSMIRVSPCTQKLHYAYL